MRRPPQHIRTIANFAARTLIGRAVILLVALSLMLGNVEVVPAQESGLQRLFDGVRRGTAVPEVFRNVIAPSEDETDSDDRQNSRQTNPDLRQPGGVHAAAGEPLPAPRIEGTVPIVGWNAAGDVDIARERNGNISMVVRDASLSRVLSLLAQTYGLNIVAANDIDAIISITLHDVPLEQAFAAILSVANYTWVQRNGIILITSLTDSAQLPADVQGRQLQVFELDFASASDVAAAVTGMLSPIGTLAVTESSETDNRRTREMIVVEDLPESLSRIAAYVYQVDRPPRQVLIEAHILQVTLKDTDRHGVNFAALLRVAGESVNLISVPSLVVPSPKTGTALVPEKLKSPAFLATIDGSDLAAVIELLQTTNDTKTLGSPKLLVLNGQEARIQIGEKIAYPTTTTTQTSSTGGAAFINTGTILLIRPRITRDGRVILYVESEVSEADNVRVGDLPPNTSTTELKTNIMLEDGQGMIIGGLIKEKDSTIQSKIPYLGDIWRIGNLFKHSEVVKERVEIIIALVPRIQPYDCDWQAHEQGELARVDTPLFGGPLYRTQRPWDAVLPDGKRVARPLIPSLPPLPQIAPTREPVVPTPPHYVPTRPYLAQRFCDDCDEPVPAFPPKLRHVEPEIAGEFVPEFTGNHSLEGSIISDQP